MKAYENVELSEKGNARRQEILQEIQGLLLRRRRHRIVFRAVLVLIPTLFIVWLSLPTTPESRPSPATKPSAPEMLTHIQFEIIRTVPEKLSQRFVLNKPTPPVLINDQELLRSLAALQRHTGLIRVADKVTLTENVTDKTKPRTSSGS